MIYVILFNQKSISGINIDSHIIKKILLELKYNVKELYLTFPIQTYVIKNVYNNIPLDGDFYIFPETLLFGLYMYLFSKKKNIILIPNIDSCPSYRKDISFIQCLQHFSKSSFFNIWSKTNQISNWLHFFHIKNTNINMFFMSDNKENVCTNTKNILLDTGNSITKRKYVNEILSIFKYNKKIPFTLYVKTVPTVYNGYKLHMYQNESNIKIINKIISLDDLDKLYNQFIFSVYISRYDGYGLSLSKAISHGHFIFCLDGFPWNELLYNYPRKEYIKCEKDGKSYFQFRYKANFKDLENKLFDYEKYNSIINSTKEKTLEFITNKNNLFINSIKAFKFIK